LWQKLGWKDRHKGVILMAWIEQFSRKKITNALSSATNISNNGLPFAPFSLLFIVKLQNIFITHCSTVGDLWLVMMLLL